MKRICLLVISSIIILLSIITIDKEKPTIGNVSDIIINIGDKIDFNAYITIYDNVSIKVLGYYNIYKEGEYKLKYVAVDKSGNKTTKPFKLIVKNNKSKLTYIKDILIVNKTYSLPENYNPGKLSEETIKSFNEMKADALSIGLNIYIQSGFRSYERQKEIYNNYILADGIDKADTYSARPGHSEHQTGLAFDLNTIDGSFANTNEGKWVNNNCYKYGFIIRYPKGKEHITGFIYEPWHLRYVGKDIASILYNNGNWLTLEEYLGISSKYNY